MTDGQRGSGRHVGEAGDSCAPVAIADGGGEVSRSLLGVIRWSLHVLSGRFTTHVSRLTSLRPRPAYLF